MKVCWLEVDWRVIQGSAGSGAFLRGKVWETFGGGRLKQGRKNPLEALPSLLYPSAGSRGYPGVQSCRLPTHCSCFALSLPSNSLPVQKRGSPQVQGSGLCLLLDVNIDGSKESSFLPISPQTQAHNQVRSIGDGGAEISWRSHLGPLLHVPTPLLLKKPVFPRPFGTEKPG